MVTDAFATSDRVVLLITPLNNSCYLLVAKIIGSLQITVNDFRMLKSYGSINYVINRQIMQRLMFSTDQYAR